MVIFISLSVVRSRIFLLEDYVYCAGTIWFWSILLWSYFLVKPHAGCISSISHPQQKPIAIRLLNPHIQISAWQQQWKPPVTPTSTLFSFHRKVIQPFQATSGLVYALGECVADLCTPLSHFKRMCDMQWTHKNSLREESSFN